MKPALTILASVVLALLATWYAIAARVKLLARAPEQATVLVLPGTAGGCVPRLARPVIRAHTDDAVEWRAVELPGCEGEGAFVIEAEADVASLFAPALRGGQRAKERTTKVTHQASAGVSVSYTVELANGARDVGRISFF